jgi:hypothetical protein
LLKPGGIVAGEGIASGHAGPPAGVHGASRWSTAAENIVFQELGAGSVEPIPWQNRDTHNHVVEVLSDAG